MNHEPECDDYQNDNVDGLCICDCLRAAYQRGREDAARAVEEVIYESLGAASVAWSELPSGVFDSNACLVEGEKCVAAARGGDQE